MKSPHLLTTARPVEQLLEQLDGVRRSGSGWVACCPAHDDNSPSLSITEGDDSRALIFCHAGCSTREIMDALGLPMRALYPRGSRSVPAPSVEPSTPIYRPLSRGAQARLYRTRQVLLESRAVMRKLRDEKAISAYIAERAGLGWDADRRCILIGYTLGDGITLAALDEWRFREHRDTNGHPSKARYGHPRPLYVPAAVLAELDCSTLLVTEGPLDALTAASHGSAAVAAPSASTWKSDFAAGVADLGSRDVVVAGDCDSAGRQWAEKTARDLAANGLRVHVLDLDPDRNDGYDLGEHLLAGGRLP